MFEWQQCEFELTKQRNRLSQYARIERTRIIVNTAANQSKIDYISHRIREFETKQAR